MDSGMLCMDITLEREGKKGCEGFIQFESSQEG
jgi:hypothetical protein